MTDTININTSRPNNFLIVGLIAAALLIFFLVWRGCGKQTELAQSKALADTLNARSERLHSKVLSDSLFKDSLIRAANRERMAYISNADSAWIALGKLQRQYNGLSGRIIVSNPTPTDTTGYAIFKRQCDSCAIALQAGSNELNQLKIADSGTMAVYRTEMEFRERYEQEIINSFDSCQVMAHAQNRLFNKTIKELTPRNSIWIGVEAAGSKQTIFQTIGAFATWQFKNGKAYTIGTGIQSIGGVYFTAKAAVKIQLHK